MGLFWLFFSIYIALALVSQMIIWMEDTTKSRWLRAKENYDEYPSPASKKRLAESAAKYVERRHLSYFWWFWPITLPIAILIVLAKTPRAMYRYFKDRQGVYAQATRHMNGDI